MKETLTAKLYTQICEQYHDKLRRLTSLDEDNHSFLTLNYDAINDSIYVINGSYQANLHVETKKDWEPVYQQLEALIDDNRSTLKTFFDVLSDALGETITPDFEHVDYFKNIVPLSDFKDGWYWFPVNIEEAGNEVAIVPMNLLVDFLTLEASITLEVHKDNPATMPDEFPNHFHMCADNDIIRHDVEAWVKEDTDAAIKGICRPLSYGYAEYHGVKVLVILN